MIEPAGRRRYSARRDGVPSTGRKPTLAAIVVPTPSQSARRDGQPDDRLGCRGPSTPRNDSLRESFCSAQDDNCLLYTSPTGNKHALIIRNFFVNPSGEYADVPWTEPDDRGYSTQACSVSGRWGEFSEMEYHVPAIGGGTGLRHIEDRSQLWAFRGSREDIGKIARALLSNEIQ